ncbi:MAG: hypothetical protein ACFFCO_03510 [Promethearchaeota archaeon]
MPIFRADLYVTATVTGFDLHKSSQQLFELFNKSSDFRNLKMTLVTRERVLLGKVRIEEWYEMTGALAATEGGKAFWILSKEDSTEEPYNFFIRVDRNITATNYVVAQKQASEWVQRSIVKPLHNQFDIGEVKVCSPNKLSKFAG